MTTNAAATGGAEVVLISVPTPVDAHLVPEVRALTAVCASAVANSRRGQTIVLTSTTYVGCTRDLLDQPLRRRGWEVGREVLVAYSPERIDPGSARHDPRGTPRVVGGVTPEGARRAAAALARTAAETHAVSSPEAAEMTKLLENAFRAVNIAVINELADAGRSLGIDPMEIVEAASTEPYGFMTFRPGAGVGGHCIPCDTHYLLWQPRAQRQPAPLMDVAMGAIATRPRMVVERARQLLADGGKPLSGARVLVLGVAHKPGVADVRESPAPEILAELAARSAQVHYADPRVPSLELGEFELVSRSAPGSERWALVVVHTVHPGEDVAWLQDQEAVLDTTYRIESRPGCTGL
ncbi:nucleotide sugar dehydrogenase [Saccharopolyspora griseoalba]|uniref:Nucleotide sugar dehydrogenase n=1 Tax=Saccharopolyspora griseoalba TaxID=1431848 RepID=A0ABW2LF48_9PSEU